MIQELDNLVQQFEILPLLRVSARRVDDPQMLEQLERGSAWSRDKSPKGTLDGQIRTALSTPVPGLYPVATDIADSKSPSVHSPWSVSQAPRIPPPDESNARNPGPGAYTQHQARAASRTSAHIRACTS